MRAKTTWKRNRPIFLSDNNKTNCHISIENGFENGYTFTTWQQYRTMRTTNQQWEQ